MVGLCRLLFVHSGVTILMRETPMVLHESPIKKRRFMGSDDGEVAPADGEVSSCDIIDEEIKGGQTEGVDWDLSSMLHGVCRLPFSLASCCVYCILT